MTDRQQSNVVKTLKAQFDSGRASHAYIIQGSKANIPQLLKQCAKIVLCPQHGCGVCDMCRKVDTEQHLDRIALPMDGRSKLNVDDIEYLVEESIKRPVDRVSARVFTLNATDSVSGSGSAVWQNKLLKTLEEPVGNTYIFIGVDNPESLFATIQSRCQVLKDNVVSTKEVMGALIEDGYDSKSSAIAAVLSQGDMKYAKRIVADNTYYDIFDAVKRMLCEMTSTKTALPYVATLSVQRDNYKTVLLSIVVLLKESVVYRVCPELCVLPLGPQDIQKICDNYSIEACIAVTELVGTVKKRLDNNGNYTVELDNMIAEMLEVKYRCRI